MSFFLSYWAKKNYRYPNPFNAKQKHRLSPLRVVRTGFEPVECIYSYFVAQYIEVLLSLKPAITTLQYHHIWFFITATLSCSVRLPIPPPDYVNKTVDRIRYLYLLLSCTITHFHFILESTNSTQVMSAHRGIPYTFNCVSQIIASIFRHNYLVEDKCITTIFSGQIH